MLDLSQNLNIVDKIINAQKAKNIILRISYCLSWCARYYILYATLQEKLEQFKDIETIPELEIQLENVEQQINQQISILGESCTTLQN
jgi:hypothetical protein